MSSYSFVTYSGNGSTTTYSFGSIPLLSSTSVPYSSQIVVAVGGVVTTDYTISGTDVVFNTAPAASSLIRISRATKADERYVDWLNSTNLNQDVMNLDSDQLFFLAQEGLDASSQAITVDVATDQLDANNKRIINVASGINASDAVNFNQLMSAVQGGVTGEFNGQGYFAYNITASQETTFTLPGLGGRNIEDINVYINGVRLRSKTANSEYTLADVGADATLTLGTPPTNGDWLEVLWPSGLVTAQIDGSEIDGSTLTGVPTSAIVAGTNGQVLRTVTGSPAWDTIDSTDLISFGLSTALGTLPVNSLDAATGTINMGSQRITNLGTATASSDAATFGQVQGEINTILKDWDTGVMTINGEAPNASGEFTLTSGDIPDFANQSQIQAALMIGASNIDALLDVPTKPVGSGEKYLVSSNLGALSWNDLPSGGGGGATDLDDLSDVPTKPTGLISDPQVLQVNTSNGVLSWVDTPSDGTDGAAATIAVGTVTTGAAGSSATVTNSGTSSAAVFDFTIPRGDTGAGGGGGTALLYGKIAQTADENLMANTTFTAATFNTSAAGNLSSGVTLVSGGIEIDTAGVYEVTYQYAMTSSNDGRATVSGQITLDTGSGASGVDMELFGSMGRFAEEESVSVSTLLSLNDGDVVGGQCRRADGDDNSVDSAAGLLWVQQIA